MKRVLGIFLGLALVAGSSVFAGSQKTYSDDSGFSIQYPSEWTAKTKVGKAAVEVVSPDKKAKVQIFAIPVTSDNSAMQLLEAFEEGFDGELMYDNKDIAKEAKKIGADDGAMSAVKKSLKNGTLVCGVAVYIKGDMGYIFTQQAMQPDLKTWGTDLGNIAKSFRVTYSGDDDDEATDDPDEDATEDPDEYDDDDDDDY